MLLNRGDVYKLCRSSSLKQPLCSPLTTFLTSSVLAKTYRQSLISVPQVAAFADYKAGSGGSGGGSKEAASGDSAQEQKPAEPAADPGSNEANPGSGGAADSSGGSGSDWPPHSVMGLPSLSPTMSQGEAVFLTGTGGEAAAGHMHTLGIPCVVCVP